MVVRRTRSVRLLPTSLFWRVLVANAIVVMGAVVLVAATPLNVSDPATWRLLALGVGVLLVANALLLWVSLQPLRRLTQMMERIDLLRPGERLEVVGARELNVVLSTFNEMLGRLERERRASSSRSISREEEERRQLAGELHDQIGQALTALLLQLKTALAEAPEPLRATLVEARAIARENLDEVRRIARRLRPAALDDLGLPYALLSLAAAAEKQADPSIVRRVDTDAPRLSEQTELALYRVAQEALTNSVRHAQASWIELVLAVTENGKRVQLAIHDDGRGMIYAPAAEGGGIRGMRERTLAIDASFSIMTRPGEGMSVTLTVPVNR